MKNNMKYNIKNKTELVFNCWV